MSNEESGVGSGELKDKGERDYTSPALQNLMTIVDELDKNAPMPLTQRQIQEATGISKDQTFRICWNLCKRGWAEDTGNGGIRLTLRQAQGDKEAWVGRMVMRIMRDASASFGEVKEG